MDGREDRITSTETENRFQVICGHLGITRANCHVIYTGNKLGVVAEVTHGCVKRTSIFRHRLHCVHGAVCTECIFAFLFLPCFHLHLCIGCIGVTLVNEIIQVSGYSLCTSSVCCSVCCSVCSPPTLNSLFTIMLTWLVLGNF